MSSQNPRDHREWMGNLERNQSQVRGIAGLVKSVTEGIIEGGQDAIERHPAAPVELSMQTGLYLDRDSRWRVRLVADFPDVVFNTDGYPALIQQYELWGMDEALPDPEFGEEQPWTLLDTNPESFFRTGGFDSGSTWRFRIRAIGVHTNVPGEWSEEKVVEMEADDVPPPQPTDPVVKSARGQLIVSWDGLAVSGQMPADFSHVILAHGTMASPTTEVARFGEGGGSHIITGADYYIVQFFRIRAVDEAGNLGPWSGTVTGFTKPLVDADLILSTIDGAVTLLKNIDAGVSILPDTVVTEHLVVTEEMTAKIANFLVVNADMINANSIWADSAFFGLADALLFRGDAFQGKTFTGGTFTGGKYQTEVAALRGIKWDTSGIKAYSSTGSLTFSVAALTGDVMAEGSFTAKSGVYKAILDGSVFSNLPGLRLDTGVVNQLQPVIFGVGTAAAGYPVGDLVVMGSEQTINSTGRTELRLFNRGGGFKLETLYGPNSGRGVELFDGKLQLSGPLSVGFSNLDTVVPMTSGTTQIGGGTWQQYFPYPVPSGSRNVQISANSDNVLQCVTQNVTASGFVVSFAGSANSNTSFRTQSFWV